MTRRVFLHIGASKTGTTYLQNLLFSNRDVLKEQGLTLPAERVDHFRFMLAVRERLDEVQRPEAAHTAWDRVIEEAREWPQDVLITNELLAGATTEQARRTLRALEPADAHIIYTVRDLVRTVPAEWQQSVKGGSAVTFDAYVTSLMDGTSETDNFRSLHDVPDVLRRWASDLPAGNVHLVTLAPSGADPDVLWNRFASVLGVDPGSCALPRRPANTSLGAVEVEVMRRVNAHLDETTTHDYFLREWMRYNFALGVLARRAKTQRFGLGPEQHGWVADSAKAIIEALAGAGYDVAGDLADLEPSHDPRTLPFEDLVGAEEVSSVAVETITDLLMQLRPLQRRPGKPRGE
jgi:hypothetical protein